MSSLLADLRLALRSWRRSPLFIAITVTSVGLGLGANTAIFTLVDQVLLRTLPIERPEELVQLRIDGARYGSNWGDGSEMSYPMYGDLRDNNTVMSGMFCRFGYNMHIGYAGRTERVAGELVSGTYFPVLGVRAALGRTLQPDDDRTPGGSPSAVLSHAFWSSRFASDPGVIGKPLIVNGNPFTIVGIAREGFEGVEVGRATQVFVPLMMKAQLTPGWDGLDDRRYNWVRVFGRLKPGVTAEQAAASLLPFWRSRLQMEVQDAAFASAPPRVKERFVQSRVAVDSSSGGRSGFRRSLTRPLWILMATAAGVLLIACANVANLLLARGAGRQREMAVRLALGARRIQLVRQLLVESLLLAFAGGLAGLAIAAVGATLVLGFFVSGEGPQPVSTLPDFRILAFTFAVSTFTGVLFGLAPALQSTRPSVAPTLKDQAGSVLGGGQARLRKALVASQVAVSLLLLIGAGLFIRTLNNLKAVDIGLKSDQLIAFSLDPSLNGYSSDRTKDFAKNLLARLRTTPGVEAAGTATIRILEGNQWSSGMTVEGYTPKGDESMGQWNNAVSPGYFAALGIPLVMGRDFEARDERLGEPPPPPPPGQRPDPSRVGYRVAIVNQKFATKYFGDASPIGRRIGFGTNPGTPTPIEIIGVVGDAKYTDVRDEIQRQVFYPYLETPRAGGFIVYVRTSRDAESMFGAVRRTVQELDANLPISETRTVANQVALSLRNERLIATMSVLFGVMATLLAVVGLYGVMAYTVSRRTREIGIRMALGARGSAIAWLIVREVLTIAGIGIAIGLPAAWWLGRYVSSQLYEVKPGDPIAIVAAVVGLATVALLAGLIPSARAARVSPTTALRYE
jgi:predicted permease